MNNPTRLLIAAGVCIALAGCKTKSATQEVPAANNGDNASTMPAADDGKYGPEDLDSNACLRQRVIYFDFNMDTLKPEFQSAIACHAKYLQDRPESRMSLEGNADERGTREYNLGLGERRGNAVSSAIQGSGGSSSQMTVVSYGEERPTCADSSEDCWSRNRRVEIVYSAK